MMHRTLRRLVRKHKHIGHPCPYPICLPTNKYSEEERLRGISKVIDVQQNKLDLIYRPLLKNLSESIHDKERCFIIGNGPSLNETNLDYLREEITFGVNGLFLKFSETEFRPTFYVVEDHLVAEDRAAQINELSGVIKLFPVYLSYCLREAPDTIFFNHLPRKSYPNSFDFSTNAEKVTYAGGTVTFTCMQLAYYLGFKRIYLIGVDHSYSIPNDVNVDAGYGVEVLDMDSDDPNHFDNSYFGRGYRWHDPRSDVMENAYKEAKGITEENGVRIINATKGGHLEVFERTNYDELFLNKAINDKKAYGNNDLINVRVCNTFVADNKVFSHPGHGDLAGWQAPRVLVVSSTIMNDYSATGALVKSLFKGWPKHSIAQIYTVKAEADRTICDQTFRLYERGFNLNKASEFIDNFRPEIIYFRPTAESRVLWTLVLDYINDKELPVVTHIMDDWPERMRLQNPTGYSGILSQFCKILKVSSVNAAICERMAKAYEQRYGGKFEVFSNFVDENEWAEMTVCANKAHEEEFVVRYCGSLADDMQLQSVIDVAVAVDSVQDKMPVKLEVFVHRRFRKNAKLLRGYRGVSVKPFVKRDEYQKMLAGSNVLLMPVNFDQRSLSYVRYSMSNKLPEYLATGVPILAYGPLESSTIEYVHNAQLAKTVLKRSAEMLIDALYDLYGNYDLWCEYGSKARKWALINHNASQVRNHFQYLLKKLPQVFASSQDGLLQIDRATLVGEYKRSSKIRFDESRVVAKYLGNADTERTMVNVGAHHGTELPLFLQKGYKIHAFEPDVDNRIILQKRFGGCDKIVIDSRAVSEVELKDVPFFTSSQSTGISSLTSFHNTHKETDVVDVTTLAKYFEEKNISSVDFLLIDAEGFDLMVLQGIPWATVKPKAIVCEFEDSKTKPLGYTFYDMANYLYEKGYEVLVSEWHPIKKYGVPHDWRRLARFPCDLANANAWGNLIAIHNHIEWDKMLSISAEEAIPNNNRFARRLMKRFSI